jgi:chlorite dismutase
MLGGRASATARKCVLMIGPTPLRVTFAGGESGAWRIAELRPVVGDPLPPVARLEMVERASTEPFAQVAGSTWQLRGVTSHERYVQVQERAALMARQPPLGRPAATRAALIPITKAPAWWALPQDERRAVFEERSRHIATGLRYLPAVARRLHHGYDLGEPFDFLTWFEYAPADAVAFEELVALLRATEEWRYVVREIDIRLTHAGE